RRLMSPSHGLGPSQRKRSPTESASMIIFRRKTFTCLIASASMHASISGCTNPSSDRYMRDEAIHLSYLKWGLISYRREYGDYPDSLEAAELARYTEGQSAFDVWGK